LKTKDLRWGLSVVFGFRLIAPQIRRRSPADLRFVGDYGNRLTLVRRLPRAWPARWRIRRAVKGGNPLERG